MNSKQFVNSALSAGLEKVPRIRKGLFQFQKFLFPEFLKGVGLNDPKNPWALGIAIYLIVFILTFVVQAYYAHSNGYLIVPSAITNCELPPSHCKLQYFFGDYANLLNYIVLVEAYCISGCFFLIYASNMDALLKSSGVHNALNLDLQNRSVFGGAGSILFVLLFVMLGSVHYAKEIQFYPPHWYLNQSEGALDSSAFYYYLFVNYTLLVFVAFVGIAHLGMFKVAGDIAKGLSEIYRSGNSESIKLWSEDERVKKWLEPLATQVLISKIFVFAIILNMTSWKVWEPNVGVMNDIAVLIMIVAGMWVVTMPRYYVQYHLFKIKKKVGLDEYKDIRMSWVLGASAVVDIVLIFIAGKILLDLNPIKEILEKVAA